MLLCAIALVFDVDIAQWTYSNSTQVRFVIRIKCRSYSFVYLDLQNWNDCNGVLIVQCIGTIPTDRTNKVIFTHLMCIGSNVWPDVLWMKWKSQLHEQPHYSNWQIFHFCNVSKSLVIRVVRLDLFFRVSVSSDAEVCRSVVNAIRDKITSPVGRCPFCNIVHLSRLVRHVFTRITTQN